MRVAAVQMRPIFKDKIANLRKLAAHVIQAAEAGAKLIVLPEMCTTGYSFMSPDEARSFAEYIRPAEMTVRAFSILAEKLNVHIVWGMAEKDEGTEQLFNSQVLISPDGSWVSYRKVNRFGSDFLWCRPGRANPPIVELEDAGKKRKVGLLICRDVRDKADKDWSSFYDKGDADIVCLSAAWGKGGIPANAWMNFVEDNDVTLAVGNVWGQEENNDFGEGGVCIIEPPDSVHTTGLVWSTDCFVIADV